jgi:ribosomal-protein-alanine N-acetyltransferase
MSLTEQTAVKPAVPDILIYRMTEHDLLEVVDIEESTGLSRWGWAAYYAELQGSSGNLMMVARVPNGERDRHRHRLAGYIVARLAADELHINNVAVRQDYRRRGIGRRLLDWILIGGKRAGAVRAFLELRAGNSAALALYEECGFRVTARRSKYYSEPEEDALVMVANLSEGLDPLP